MLCLASELILNTFIVKGLKMLYEAWKMKPNEGEETQREVEEELARRGSSPSVNDMGKLNFCKHFNGFQISSFIDGNGVFILVMYFSLMICDLLFQKYYDS